MGKVMTEEYPFLANQIFIADDFLDVGSSGEIEHRYPATGEVNGKVTLGGSKEIGLAVEAARKGAITWEALGPIERRQRLSKLADLIEAWEGGFRALAAAETGLPRQGFDTRHRVAVEWIRTYSGWADKVGGDVTAASDAGRFEYTRLEPYGVVGIILTWNSPLLSLTMKIPAALAAGNSVVVKPSELTPYTPLLFARACKQAGIPAGVVNIIPGGIEAGEALVVHPNVEKISFTGGIKAATAMMRSGAPLIKPFCFELGGKSSQLVFDDVDMALAAKVACSGLANAGQSCTFGSRIYVHDNIYNRFSQALAEEIGKIVVGDPTDERTSMGPLATSDASNRVISFIERTVKNRDGELLLGGKAPKMEGKLAGGYFVQPTVFQNVDPNSALMREEIFGPVFGLQRFTEEDEAVAAANNTEFGLSNYVHTNDLRRAIRVTSRLKSGTVYVNDAFRNNAAAPFGGYRRSGIGYEGGRPGLDEFLRRKRVGLV
jgi:aldehyde dehydrogenase (NAD+)